MGLFFWIWFGELMYFFKILGFILGFVGVFVICFGGLKGYIFIIGICFVLGFVLSWVFGIVFMKKIFNKVDGIWFIILYIIIGGLFLMVFGIFIESWLFILWNLVFIVVLLFIFVFVIVLGWFDFFIFVSLGEVSKVFIYIFLIFIIFIIVSLLFLKELIIMNLLVGFLLVIFSIIFVSIKLKILKFFLVLK